ncbi:MAG: hypothetical protein ACYCUY_00655 [Acidithiobacillus sp.]
MSYIVTSDGNKTPLVKSKNDVIENITKFNSCAADFRVRLLKSGRVFVYRNGIGFCPSRFCGYLDMSQDKWDYLYSLEYGLDGTITTREITRILGKSEHNPGLDLMLSNEVKSTKTNKKYWVF